MAKSKEQIFVQFKYALALQRLLESNKKKVKKNIKEGKNDKKIDNSYGKISSSTNLRKATISEVFSGISEMKAYTMFQILNSLGKTYTQFGRIMDKITDAEVELFIRSKEEEKNARKSNK